MKVYGEAVDSGIVSYKSLPIRYSTSEQTAALHRGGETQLELLDWLHSMPDHSTRNFADALLHELARSFSGSGCWNSITPLCLQSHSFSLQNGSVPRG